MTPAARLQAAIEILDQVIASARSDEAPADALVTRYFKTRRYAGSKDRRAVRELVFRGIRRSGEIPNSGRSVIIGLAQDERGLLDMFGEARGPAPLLEKESGASPGQLPQWLESELSPLVGRDEWPALLDRAPVDLRANVARIARDALLAAFPDGQATPHSPWGIRLPFDTRVDDRDEYRAGRFDVQDEGSQLIALACRPADGLKMLDLCAGAGGKSLALAAAAPGAAILATDVNRARLSRLAPRAERAGALIETRLLSAPRELEQLDDWRGQADVVLIDAPCSGSGTWRRNPEGRWRLTPERLDRLAQTQGKLLDLAADLVRPGGVLVYAVCSILSREGAAQIERFLSMRSSWISEEMPIAAGRLSGAGRLLTPAHDGTDGFFIARLGRPC